MNKVIAEYWFCFVIAFIGLCIFGKLSVKAFKTRNEKREDSVFAKEKWYKPLKVFGDYGITIIAAIFFLPYLLDLPYVLGNNYHVKEGTITCVYDTSIDIDGADNYTTITTNLYVGAKVKVVYLPFTKNAPIVEIIY